jgi:hypothetical protein
MVRKGQQDSAVIDYISSSLVAIFFLQKSGADLGTISSVGCECREQGEDLGTSDVRRKRNGRAFILETVWPHKRSGE